MNQTQKHSETQSQGNTIPDSSRARRWCFTLNNYTCEEAQHINTYICDRKYMYIVGEEIGEQGTPHLQGYIECKNPIAFTTLQKINPRIHWEKAKGTKKQNIEYCSKEGKFHSNINCIKKVKDPLEGKEMRKFQKDIMDVVKEEPSERKIYWFWDKNGNTGKTALAKHLCLKYPNKTIFLGGKGSDIKYGVWQFLQEEENDLKICIFHFTRSVENYISYEALESIKDGIFYNTKYESQMCIFDTPHIICLANFEPDEDKLSKDRWIIKEINDEV